MGQIDFGWLGSAVVAALVAAVVSFLINERKLNADNSMFEKRFDFDKDLAERKAAADIRIAERKLDLDRALMDWKRRTELAENVLADFYKAQAIFDNARSPISHRGEGATRPQDDWEAEATTNLLNTYYAPLERLNKELDFLSELHAKRYRFMALFGNGAGVHFQVFVRTYNRVSNATRMLIAPGAEDYEQDLRQRLQADIGWTVDANDGLRAEINAAVQAVEALCQPVITVQWQNESRIDDVLPT